MLNRPSIAAFDSGTVRVGDELSTAEPLWIEPYTAVLWDRRSLAA
jgi:hypothetical protein